MLDFLPSMRRALCKTGSVLRTVITAAGQQKKGQRSSSATSGVWASLGYRRNILTTMNSKLTSLELG